MRQILKLVLKLMPFVLGLAFVSTQLETKSKRSFSFKRAFVLFVLLSFGILLTSMVYVRAHYGDTFTGRTDGCAVVFGAAVWKGDQPSNALNDRTQAAIELYKQGKVECLIFSGGDSKYGAHEATVMGKLAQEAEVPVSAVEYDFDGDNTLSTILNLSNDKPYVMVSNDFHLARIALMAQRAGITEYYLHAATYEYGPYNKNFTYYWREVAGTLVTWFGL